MPFTFGDEVSIRTDEGNLLLVRVKERYKPMGAEEFWLVLVEPQTGTQFRRPESRFLKKEKKVDIDYKKGEL